MQMRHAAIGVCVALFLVSFFCGQAEADDGLLISSPAFANGGQMPPKYARTHDNISPPLEISGVPSGTKSLALIVDDPDAPSGLFTHWVVWNISTKTTSIPERGPSAIFKLMQAHAPQLMPSEGRNSFGDTHYDGPQPPNGKHRYFFHLYGLDTTLSLPAGSDRHALEAAMKGHIVAQAPDFYGTFATGQ